MTVQQVVQWASAACGIAAAVLWWLSTRQWIAYRITTELDIGKGGEHDLAFVLADGKTIVQRDALVGKINAWAAGLSGATVALQAIAPLLPDVSVWK